MPASRPISKVVKLDPDIQDRLEHRGELKHRSPHWLMKEAITRYLEQEEYIEQLNSEILALCQEAERGKLLVIRLSVHGLKRGSNHTQNIS